MNENIKNIFETQLKKGLLCLSNMIKDAIYKIILLKVKRGIKQGLLLVLKSRKQLLNC